VPYQLRFARRAAIALKDLEQGDANQQAKLRKVRKALARLAENPRHPGLVSHLYESFPVDRDVTVWDSYVENRTPGAWRIFWCYGPAKGVITVLAITPHP